MKKKNRFVTGIVTAGVLFSTALPFNVLAENPINQIDSSNAQSLLSKLSKEQRQALQTLDANPGFTISPDINTSSSEPVNIIVEFQTAPVKINELKQKEKGLQAAPENIKARIDQEHEEFQKGLKRLYQFSPSVKSGNFQSVQIKRSYKHAINGVALTLPANTVEELLRIGVVKRIWKDYEVKLNLPKQAEQKAPQKLTDSIPQIGVDKLHSEGITGKGIKVGVLDTGIDYNHPDLKDVYKGYRAKAGEDSSKVDPNSVKGWDFINNDADPMETTYTEWQQSGAPEFDDRGSSFYTAHGTHVAGIVSAQKKNKSDSAVKGVAPDIELYNYRVLGPYGSGDSSGIIAAIDKSISDGMNVINLSLGDDSNNPLDPTSIAVNNAMLSGVVTVVAAGNSGPNPATLGSPGASPFAITVGASDSSISLPKLSGHAGQLQFPNLILFGKNFTDKIEDFKGQSLPIESVGIGTPDEFSKKDVKGKIALVVRGTISFDEKIANAKQAGAKAVIIYNNVDGEISYYIGESTKYIPAFRLTKEDGEKLKAQIKQGKTSLTFDEINYIQTEGDHLADFSSRGPVTSNDDIKPDITAPGVAVLSTVPEYINDPQEGENYDVSYERMQGTSMASPHIAGVAALILQEHPEYSPFDVKTSLMNTADDLKEKYSVYEVGAGRVDAYNSVHTETSFKVLDTTKTVVNDEVIEVPEETGSIAFGKYYQKDGESLEQKRKIKVENRNKQEKKEFKTEISYTPASSAINDATANGVKVSTAETITIDAGKSDEIEAKINIPAGAKQGRYEGYIHITNTKNKEETYQIPFSIRVSEPGIENALLSRKTISTDTSKFNPYRESYLHGAFQLNSELETLDLIVKDSKTNKALGFIGTLNTSGLKTDVYYYLDSFFNGRVYPFTNDPAKPIGDEKIDLPEGDYTIEFVGYDKAGKARVKGDYVVIDNTPPEVKLTGLQPGIYELNEENYTVEDGKKALWIKGNVYDSNVDYLKGKGFNITQEANGVMYYDYSPYLHKFLPINANGDFKVGITPESFKVEGPMNTGVYIFDYATAGPDYPSGVNNYWFIPQGAQYAKASYDKKELYKDDEFTVTLNAKHVKQFVSGEFNVKFLEKNFKFANAKLNPAFEKLLSEKGVTAKVNEPKLEEGSVTVGGAIDDKNFAGLDGDFPFIDVTFKVENDEFYEANAQLDLAVFAYWKQGESEPNRMRVLQDQTFSVMSLNSLVEGNIKPGAFLNERGYLDEKFDYTKLGVKVYATDSYRHKFEGSLDKYGYFKLNGLPVNKRDYNLYVEVPGHLTSRLTTKLGTEKDGKLLGQYYYARFDENLAGDVNGDKVIDVKDAEIIASNFGKKGLSVKDGDLNKDGIIDEKDIRFVEKNFLKKGPDASKSQTPVEKSKSGTLADILKKLGLTPKK
ncbi:Peptidase Vpr; Serine peptidase; MEROPS family S08A [Bacillus cereus AH1271]|uniref:S8 family serine peptidase n=1 Tax=Bacillus paramobilis TaxID=2817477 RepID=UPI0001A12E85|nr:Peptidase Vpr; Serine peptidase; MEROPS family S08A [Bacillus cereus AH1271]PEU84786.1 peptidase S8 [Bacillus cereus]